MFKRCIRALFLSIFVLSVVFGQGGFSLSTHNQAKAEYIGNLKDTTVQLPYYPEKVSHERPFQSMIGTWQADSDDFSIQVKVKDYWVELEHDHDAEREEDGEKEFSRMIFVDSTKDLEYRIVSLSSSEVHFSYLEFIVFTQETSYSIVPSISQAEAKIDGMIISRSEWGADNNYITLDTWSAERDKLCEKKPWYCEVDPAAQERVAKQAKDLREKYPDDTKIQGYEYTLNGEDLIWPVSKSANIKKLIVHHSATLNKDQNGDGVVNQVDEQIAIRSIYYYHSVIRGWGDIAYNYIVGPTGTIYEGRYGGDYAVGAHAVWRNISSIGIANLGNFEEESLNERHTKGLVSILGYLANKYNLTPTKDTLFYGKTTPTVIGHRDSGASSTACPGHYIYTNMPRLRAMADLAKAGSSVTIPNDFSVIDSAPTPAPVVTETLTSNTSYASTHIPGTENITFLPYQEKNITISILNTGTEIWTNNTYLSFVSSHSEYFIVASGNKSFEKSAIIQNAPVAPGSTATFTLTLVAKDKEIKDNIRLLPVANGSYRMTEFFIPVSTTPFTSFSPLRGGSSGSAPVRVGMGEHAEIQIQVRNSGSTVWENLKYLPLKVSLQSEDKSFSVLGTGSFTKDRVLPNESVNISMPIQSHYYPFNGKVMLDISVHGYPVFAGDTYINLLIPDEETGATVIEAPEGEVPLRLFQDFEATLKVKNNGSITWKKADVKVIAIRDEDAIRSASWDGDDVITTFDENSNIEPGEVATFTIPIKGNMKGEARPRFMLSFVEGPQLQMVPTDIYVSVGDRVVGGLHQKTSTLEFGNEIAGNIQSLIASIVPHAKIIASTQAASTPQVQEKPAPETTSQAVDVDAVDTKDTIRVKIGYTEKRIITLKSYEGSFQVGSFTVPEGKSATITYANPNEVVIGYNGEAKVESNAKFVGMSQTSKIQIVNWERGTDKTTKSDTVFRGNLEVYPGANELIVVNELPFKHYMYGVAEIGASSPLEKKKTMTIVIRSYARYYMIPEHKRKDESNLYDMTDSPDEYQRYRGYKYELRHPGWVEAVDATENIVVTYNNVLIKPPYFSESDGRTRSGEEVWGWTDTPFLISKDDSFCKGGNGTLKGHGVGLSSCGAEFLAISGKTHEEILKYYYTGVDLRPLPIK